MISQLSSPWALEQSHRPMTQPIDKPTSACRILITELRCFDLDTTKLRNGLHTDRTSQPSTCGNHILHTSTPVQNSIPSSKSLTNLVPLDAARSIRKKPTNNPKLQSSLSHSSGKSCSQHSAPRSVKWPSYPQQAGSSKSSWYTSLFPTSTRKRTNKIDLPATHLHRLQ